MAYSHSAQNPVVKQRVIITNKHGEKLVGLLHETESKEVVVLCHGLKSSKDDNILVNLAAALEKEGISAFRFDFAANGESEGSSSELRDLYREADDIRAVVQHFFSENRVVRAIIGHSKGASLVLLYASKYQDIGIIVNVSGRYNLQRGIAEGLGADFMEKIKEDGYIDVKNKKGSVEFRVTEEVLMNTLRTDMCEACRKISKECRVLIVHGSADTVIPVEDALGFAKSISNHQLQIIEGADHVYTSHQTELASAVVKFIKPGLKRDKVARL
ncbi:hypothetical protein like AT1G29840 [Hibiscus trionum]|uniref:Serine aminopeptidase S33 domain-containing protein n=1 Tax=Hibiscus trionum TaxID=183268 RepID=A0A9W7J3G2_HIBTR|nr:hypothetical protein like AT1G29840 [Hibiscus trionum]